VIQRFYVHNFRCLENFKLPIEGFPSILLIGKNGAGKTTVGLALEILQRIARGVNRVNDLVTPEDFARGRSDVPMSFEIEARLNDKTYIYHIAFEFPQGFKELRVSAENLSVDNKPIFTRKMAQVTLVVPTPPRGQGLDINKKSESGFYLDWHLAALPLVQDRGESDPLSIFRRWLARVIILRPIPSNMEGTSENDTLTPNPYGTDFGAWFTGLLAYKPAAYGTIDRYLKKVMPDLEDIKNPIIGRVSRSLDVQFSNKLGRFTIPFRDLSDGEKCFMICALVLAANEAYGPLVCFWDEPDNYLSLSEVWQFVATLRQAFQSGGQFIATSHHEEAIRRFSDENTLLLYRDNHLEPTKVRPLSEIKVKGDLVSALIRDDLEP